MRIVKEISPEYVRSKVNSIDIYLMYMPWSFSLNKLTLNPFKHEDTPSFMIGTKFGEVTHKAFNSEHRGDAISFVMQMFSLSYMEAVLKIAEDFGLKEKTQEKYLRVMSSMKRPESLDCSHIHIQAEAKPWTQQHIDYLAQGFLEPSDLNISLDTTAYALDKWWINKVRQPIKKDEMGFIYKLKSPNGEWLKIYRPQADKKLKWRSSIPFQEMHGVNGLSGCDLIIVAKSVKDAAFLKKYITPCICVVQAEDISAISKENIDLITKAGRRVYTSFDADKKGVDASKEINEITRWGWVNTPQKLLSKGVTDWFEWAAYEKSIEPILDHFKRKSII